MRVEVVAVGTELLLGQIVDSNSSWIGEQLALAGLDSYFQTKVGDNLTRIAEVIELALSRSDAVICTGGLGPTQDDLTREAIARVDEIMGKIDSVGLDNGAPSPSSGGVGAFVGGASLGDYDSDGFPDVYVACYGANVLYHNQGDGSFIRREIEAGVAETSWATGAGFFDADNDGDGAIDWPDDPDCSAAGGIPTCSTRWRSASSSASCPSSPSSVRMAAKAAATAAASAMSQA